MKMKIEPAELGMFVKMLRKDRCWSMHQLAEKAGVSVPTVSRLEKVERGVSWDIAVAILSALGYEVEIVKKGEGK